jgi:hypothetical protein
MLASTSLVSPMQPLTKSRRLCVFSWIPGFPGKSKALAIRTPRRKRTNPQQAGEDEGSGLEHTARPQIRNSTSSPGKLGFLTGKRNRSKRGQIPSPRTHPRRRRTGAAGDDTHARGRNPFSGEGVGSELGGDRRGRGLARRAHGAGRGLLYWRRCAQRLARFGKALPEAPGDSRWRGPRPGCRWTGPTCRRPELYGRSWVPLPRGSAATRGSPLARRHRVGYTGVRLGIATADLKSH